MSITRKQENIITLLTFIILYCSVGYYCKNMLAERVNIFLSFGAILLIFLFLRKKFFLSKQMICLFIILMSIGIVSSLMAGDNVVFIIYPIINMFLAILYASVVTLELFKKVFVRIVCLVSTISILCGILYYLIPDIFDIFPIIINTAGNGVRDLFLIVVPDSGYYRVQGFTWEAGVFQFLINIAIAFLILSNEWTRKKIVSLIILAIALILTFSTTGYIVGMINFFLFLSRKCNGTRENLVKTIIKIAMFVVCLCIIIPILPTSISGVSFGMAKITRFMQGVSTAESMDSSSVRFDSIYYPAKIFIQHPILGVGYNGLSKLTLSMRHSMLTCTIVNYFAMYGIVYGSIIVAMWMNLAKKLFNNKLIVFLVGLEFILGTISEQLVNYLIIDILMFMGLTRTDYILKEQE